MERIAIGIHYQVSSHQCARVPMVIDLSMLVVDGERPSDMCIPMVIELVGGCTHVSVREHPVQGDFPSTGEMEILATGGIPLYWGNADFSS